MSDENADNNLNNNIVPNTMNNNINNEAKKKLSFFELNLKYKNRINIDYTEYDSQKGDNSPRLLFKKRKLDANSSNYTQNSSSKDINILDEKGIVYFYYLGNKTANRIKNTFENYLDYVHDSYFTVDTSTSMNTNTNNNISSNNNDDINNYDSLIMDKKVNCFKFSSLDLLVNPLRSKFIFETWSPYDIALFECCVCKFGKSFDLYPKIIKTKNKDEILSFYYYWKQSKYYKTWKNSRYKKLKNNK